VVKNEVPNLEHLEFHLALAHEASAGNAWNEQRCACLLKEWLNVYYCIPLIKYYRVKLVLNGNQYREPEWTKFTSPV
jgi:hypothetical protein